MRHAIIAVLLLAAIAGTAVAGPFEDAVSAVKRGDHDEAVRLYRRAAEQGHLEAQSSLAFMYGEGWLVPKDYAEALKWARLSAGRGYALAQFILGNMYKNGSGVPKDYAAAARWYRKAADQGDAYAQNDLGAMYFNGDGVELDFEQAHFWFTMAVRLFPPGSEREQAARNLAIAGGNLMAAQISENERKAEALRQEFATAVPEPAGEALQLAVKTAPEAAPKPAAATAQQAIAAPPVQAPEARSFVIQLASLNDTDTAMAEKTRLENIYAELLGEVEMSVQRAELDKRGTVFRIVIGPYAEKAPADELCGRLKLRNQDCYVVRR